MAIGVICQECQHTNPEGNRFCGMCGALLPTKARIVVREPVEVAARQRPEVLQEPGPVARRAAAKYGTNDVPAARTSSSSAAAEKFLERAPRTAATSPRPAPVSGPSFLGLNQPYDDEGRPYRDDDDLYGPSWGGRVAVGLIILIVIAVLGYLQWRSMNAEQARPGPPAAAPEQQAPAVTNAPPSDPAAPNAAAGVKANAPVSYGAPEATQPNATSGQTAGAQTAGGQTGGGQAAGPSASNGTPTNIGGTPSTPNSNAASQVPESDKADERGERRENSKAVAPAERATAAPRDPEAYSQGSVEQAEVYLQGKGVPQNCDEGIGILRAAEARGNLPAIVKLGALYETGACVPQNRVSAYHYFTRAYRMEPHGELLEHNRVMLWDSMSDAERQQASDQDGPLQ